MTLVVAMDISHEKRRQVLEQAFFHDLTNTAFLINGLIELLDGADRDAGQEREEVVDHLGLASRRMLDELEAHRQFAAAEAGDLVPDRQPIDARALLAAVIRTFRGYANSGGPKLALDPSAASVVLESDPALLGRIVSNMVKNALEASEPGEVVTVGCERTATELHLWVHNVRSMPMEAWAQVFQRHYSTKGPGRGLGTYSMRLLAERYLGGRVSVTSSAVAGTRFTASFPLPAAGWS